MVVIDGHGGYVPLYRIDREEVADQHDGRGRGESAVPGRDENHITMASEAAGNALERSGVDAEDLDAVFAASVSDYYAEHGIAAHVAYRHEATGDVRTGDFQATARAATDALAAAKNFVENTGGQALVVAADVIPVDPGHDEEAESGAGAGAVVLRPDADDPDAELGDVGQETNGFVERHREHGEAAEVGDAKFEGNFGAGPAVAAAAERAGAGDADRAVVGTPQGRHIKTALGQLGDAEQTSVRSDVGYAGAASFYVDLVHALEEAEAGETISAVTYGPGGADVVSVSVESGTDDDVLTVAEYVEAKEHVTYAKHLEYRERYDYEGVQTS